MGNPGGHHKISQIKPNIVWYHLYVETKKNTTSKLKKKKQTHRYREQISGLSSVVEL